MSRRVRNENFTTWRFDDTGGCSVEYDTQTDRQRERERERERERSVDFQFDLYNGRNRLRRRW